MSSTLRFTHLRLGNGVRLHYAESGDASGKPVVLLHGWPDSWFSFSRLLPNLSSGLRTLVPDQRGFGESDRPASGYAIAEMADDVLSFLRGLGIERATVVGHSFGSFVARQVAIQQPSRVEALVLIGTGFTASNSIVREVQSSLRDLPDPVPREFARDFQAGTVHHRVPPEFFDGIVTESLKLPSRLWRMTLDSLIEYDDSALLSRIDAPTLLLWGDHDALFSRSDQDRLLATLPNVQLTVYEDTGHCPNWERPERVAADIEAFTLHR